MPTQSPQATDNFPGGSLSPNYTVMRTSAGGAYGFTVAGNQATGENLLADCFANRNSESYTTDQYVKFKIEVVSAGNQYVQPIVQAKGARTDATNTLDFYSVWCDGASDGEAWKKIQGLETDKQAFTSGLPTNGDIICIEVVGDVLTFYKNGVALSPTVNMGSNLIGGTPGIGTSGNAVLSNAEFGNMTSGVVSTGIYHMSQGCWIDDELA